MKTLTQVEHRGNEAPPDDELAALEDLLQPLLGLFTQFSHGSHTQSFRRFVWIRMRSCKVDMSGLGDIGLPDWG